MEEQVQKLERFYTFDRHELGRMLIVAAVTLLVFSVHSVTSLQESYDEMQRFDQQFDQMSLIVNSQAFNQSLTILERVAGRGTAGQFEAAANAFRQVELSAQKLDRIQAQQQGLYETYQWLVLLSVLGIVAGVVLLLM